MLPPLEPSSHLWSSLSDPGRSKEEGAFFSFLNDAPVISGSYKSESINKQEHSLVSSLPTLSRVRFIFLPPSLPSFLLRLFSDFQFSPFFSVGLGKVLFVYLFEKELSVSLIFSICVFIISFIYFRPYKPDFFCIGPGGGFIKCLSLAERQ